MAEKLRNYVITNKRTASNRVIQAHSPSAAMSKYLDSKNYSIVPTEDINRADVVVDLVGSTRNSKTYYIVRPVTNKKEVEGNWLITVVKDQYDECNTGVEIAGFFTKRSKALEAKHLCEEWLKNEGLIDGVVMMRDYTPDKNKLMFYDMNKQL
jgi:hypothetical protein